MAEACPKCKGVLISTGHGPYCPSEYCKWGWEVEMDGSPLKAPVPDYKALCELAARVLLQHMNDEDYELSLAGLYARLTEHT